MDRRARIYNICRICRGTLVICKASEASIVKLDRRGIDDADEVMTVDGFTMEPSKVRKSMSSSTCRMKTGDDDQNGGVVTSKQDCKSILPLALIEDTGIRIIQLPSHEPWRIA